MGSESICVGCGMCCDGTLFGHVDVMEQDRPHRLVALGVPIRAGTSGPQFDQPCSCSVDGRCTIYEVRPRTCRSFRCELLVAVEAGDVETDLARAIIERTKRERDEVLPDLVAAVGEGARAGFFNLHQEMHRRMTTDTPADRRTEHGPLLLRSGVVHVLLTRHFYARQEPVSSRSPSET